jgi:hypothetical protein
MATALRFDGAAWTEPPNFPSAFSMTGGAHDDLLAATGDGLALYFNGSTWTPVGDVLTYVPPVWGSSARGYYGRGGTGQLFHWNQTPGSNGWASIAVPGVMTIDAIGGTAADDIFVVGRGQGAAHFDGQAWSAIPLEITPYYPNVWGVDRGVAITVGIDGSVVRLAAEGAAILRGASTARSSAGVWGVSGQDFVVVRGSGADSAQHFDGTVWRSLTLPEHGPLLAVWGAHLKDVYIAATDVLLHCRG